MVCGAGLHLHLKHDPAGACFHRIPLPPSAKAPPVTITGMCPCTALAQRRLWIASSQEPASV